MSAVGQSGGEGDARGLWVERDRKTGDVLIRGARNAAGREVTIRLKPVAARLFAARVAAASSEEAEGLVEGVQALGKLAADGKRFYDGFRAIFGEDISR